MSSRGCVVWGIGGEYESIINLIRFEEYKKNLHIVGLVVKKSDMVGKWRDGYPLICKEELSDIIFDYIIVASTIYYGEIIKEAIELGVARERIINGQIFRMALFDFDRYANLIEQPVTILSDDCWGGILYHRLLLPFTSPCINNIMKPDSFLKFVREPFYYFEQPLHMTKEIDFEKEEVSIGEIGEREKKIYIEFVHSRCFSEGAVLWNRRKERVNPRRLLIKMTIQPGDERKDEYLEQLSKLPYRNICFYKENSQTNILYLKRYEHRWSSNTYTDYRYPEYVKNMDFIFKDIDILKLLNGDEGYMREI